MGGFTQARRTIVDLGGSRTGFRKEAVDDLTAGWLRAETAVYERLGPRPWLPEVLDAGEGWLLLEDLSGAHWPPPWRPGDAERARAVLGEINALPGAGLAGPPDLRSWARVAEAPAAVADLGVCTPQWLEGALPTLVEADDDARVDGDSLLHLDFRSDNLCFAGDRTVVVDWNWACSGNPELDLVAWLPSLAREGGPAPQVVHPDADPALVALLAGWWAREATQPPPFPGSTLREVQKAQLAVTLSWAADLLALPELAVRRRGRPGS